MPQYPSGFFANSSVDGTPHSSTCDKLLSRKLASLVENWNDRTVTNRLFECVGLSDDFPKQRCGAP
jgi:hypothetical protein